MDEDTEEITTPAGRFRVRIEYDQAAESPRDWDNIGEIEVVQRGHYLSTNDPYVTGTVYDAVNMTQTPPSDSRISTRALCRYLRIALDAHTVLPLYNGTDGPSAGDPDSTTIYDGEGVIGVTYAPNEKARVELALNPEWDVAGALRIELDTYNKWARGDFTGFIVERFVPECEHGHGDEWVQTDSVWGFDDPDYAREQGREFAESYDVTAFRQQCRHCGDAITWTDARPMVVGDHHIIVNGTQQMTRAHWFSARDGERQCTGNTDEHGNTGAHEPADWTVTGDEDA
jgi:hypothetical protein